MNTNFGICYIILFSNNYIKGGKSSNFLRRYKTHKSTAIALGISVKKAFYTEPHHSYHDTEKRLLLALSSVSENRVGEFFRGVTESAAIEALCSLGFEINSIEECTFGLHQDMLIEIAKDREITGEVYRVLFYALGQMDFENRIHATQGEAAAVLGLQKTNVSRAFKTLCDKGILIKGPKEGRSATYQLNSGYGWKGKVKNFQAERSRRLKLLKGGKEDAPEAQDAAAGPAQPPRES